MAVDQRAPMKTYASMFSGGGLADLAAAATGLRPIWGLEIDPAISAVATANGLPSLVADVLAVDPHNLEAPDVLHASPPCTRASVANSDAKESPLDVELGQQVARFIDVLRPRVFTLENVYAYRNFVAFQKITAALMRGGYMWDFDHLNAADYGVPQTRKRLVLRAVRGSLLPNLPPPVPWAGWYGAVADLVSGMPESKFAPWQLERLPAELRGPRVFIMAGSGNTNFADAEPGGGVRYDDEPAHVVAAGGGGRTPRAFLVDGGNKGTNATDGITIRAADEPAFTVVASGKLVARSWLSAGRVVKMTSRALARFQTVPDTYRLPDKDSLATLIIGNGVACRMFETVLGDLVKVAYGY